MYIKGDVVAFLAAGKVSRLDGVAGTWVRGTYLYEDEHGIHIKKEYESLCENCVVPYDKVRLV